jgi:hypothetical protein
MKRFILSCLIYSVVVFAGAIVPANYSYAEFAPSDYTPKEVVVCDLKSTSVKICWKTTAPSNSEVVYGKDTETLDSAKNKPQFKAGTTFINTDNHDVTLTGLAPATKYKYIVRSSPNAATTSTASAEYTFTTKNTDGTGGSGTTAPPAFDWDGTIHITDPTGDGQIGPVLTKIINWFLLVISLVAIIVMIYAGLLLVFNRGNEAQITKAKTTLVWAVIGLVVALGSFALVYLIQEVLK